MQRCGGSRRPADNNSPDVRYSERGAVRPLSAAARAVTPNVPVPVGRARSQPAVAEPVIVSFSTKELFDELITGMARIFASHWLRGVGADPGGVEGLCGGRASCWDRCAGWVVRGCER